MGMARRPQVHDSTAKLLNDALRTAGALDEAAEPRSHDDKVRRLIRAYLEAKERVQTLEAELADSRDAEQSDGVGAAESASDTIADPAENGGVHLTRGGLQQIVDDAREGPGTVALRDEIEITDSGEVRVTKAGMQQILEGVREERGRDSWAPVPVG